MKRSNIYFRKVMDGQHFISVYLITKLLKSWVKTNLKRQNVEQKKMQFVVQRHEVKNEYNSPQLPLSNSHQNFATIGFLRVFLHAKCNEIKFF